MEQKVSIIVPIYRVEDYLDRCVESLVAQTYEQLEILLVDDGSPDSCPAMVDAWASRDSRIVALHKENGGLSDARNYGLERATGDYIAFVDSDDYVAPDYIERMLAEQIRTGADIVSSGLYYAYADRLEELPLTVPAPQVMTGREAMEAFFTRGGVELCVVWNKLYRREIFTTEHASELVRFPVGRLHEDNYTTFRLYHAAERVALIADPLYYYVQRGGSIMATWGEKNMRDNIDCLHYMLDWGEHNAPEIRALLVNAAYRGYLGLLTVPEIHPNIKLADYPLSDLRRAIERHIKATGGYLNNPYATGKDKVKYIIERAGLFLPIRMIYRGLKRLLGKGNNNRTVASSC